MVYDRSKFGKGQKQLSKKEAEALDKLKQAIAHPTPSALIYGYLKEKNLNLKEMTVEQWREMEKDLVEIILAEVYPGEDVQEDQLNFTTLAHSIAFMSNFIEQLNAAAAGIDDLSAVSDKDSEDDKEGPKFEV